MAAEYSVRIMQLFGLSVQGIRKSGAVIPAASAALYNGLMHELIV